MKIERNLGMRYICRVYLHVNAKGKLCTIKMYDIREKCRRLHQSADRSADRQKWCQSTDECPEETDMH